jgi:hypothetical protein
VALAFTGLGGDLSIGLVKWLFPQSGAQVALQWLKNLSPAPPLSVSHDIVILDERIPFIKYK